MAYVLINWALRGYAEANDNLSVIGPLSFMSIQTQKPLWLFTNGSTSRNMAQNIGLLPCVRKINVQLNAKWKVFATL